MKRSNPNPPAEARSSPFQNRKRSTKNPALQFADSTRSCRRQRAGGNVVPHGCQWDRANGGGWPTSPAVNGFASPKHFNLTDCNRDLASIKRFARKTPAFFCPAFPHLRRRLSGTRILDATLSAPKSRGIGTVVKSANLLRVVEGNRTTRAYSYSRIRVFGSAPNIRPRPRRGARTGAGSWSISYCGAIPPQTRSGWHRR